MSDSCHDDLTLPGNDPSSQTVTNSPGMVYVPMPELTKPPVWRYAPLTSNDIGTKLDRIIDLLEILINPTYHFGGVKDPGEPTL